MKYEMLEVNGRKVSDSQTVTPDHSVQTFTVSIRTLCGISLNRVKDILEGHVEVTAIEETNRQDFVQAGMRDF